MYASLAVRGLAESGTEGRRRPTGSLAPLVELALAPDVVLWIERFEEDEPDGWWIGVRTDAALQLTVFPGGGRESAWLDPAGLMDHSASTCSRAPLG